MPIKPIVLIRNVRLNYNGRSILDDISLTINQDQHWALIGPNGSGKTSLISIINGYHYPSDGEIEVLGYRFGSADLRDMRRYIGECSSQIRNMIHPNDKVKDIILSGRFGSIGLYERPDTLDLERAAELMEFLALSSLSDRRFRTLSLGEQQKTLIARALLPAPLLLVLDEPCEGLDLKAREELLETVERMCKRPGGPVLIYITHRIEEIIPAITHAAVLKQGRIMAQGPRKTVITGDVLSRTFEVAVDVHEMNGRLWPTVSTGQVM